MDDALFIRFSSLGDVALTTGVIRYYHGMMPEARVDVLTAVEYAPLFTGLPFVREVFTIDRSMNALKIASHLHKELPPYRYVFDLHGSLRSRIIRTVVTGSHTTYEKASMYRRLYVRSRKGGEHLTEHVVQRYADAIVDTLGIKPPRPAKLRPEIAPREYRGDVTRPNVVIHPFASKATKEWPHAVDLAKRLVDEGYGVTFVGFGQKPDVYGAVDLVNETDLNGMIAAMSAADVVVSTDSGPMHVAIGLNKPLIALFGSTTKHFGFYPAIFDGVTVIEKELSCRPCHIHGLAHCPEKHFRCMLDISVDEVMDTIRKITGPARVTPPPAAGEKPAHTDAAETEMPLIPGDDGDV